MKRLLKTICLLLIMLLIVLSSYTYVRARHLYNTKISELSIEDAVKQYTYNKYLTFDEIDEDFVNAVVSVEDKRFFDRKGYDYIALIRAIYNNIIFREFVEGGSTITEQIAKNLYLERTARSLEEKICEIMIMYDLEEKYSKEELFALYANMNYYGDGYWGLKNAARGYYKAQANDLSLAKAAILAGIPNAPSAYQLSTGYELAKNRQEKVLTTMVNNNIISEQEKAEALLEDVTPIK